LYDASIKIIIFGDNFGDNIPGKTALIQRFLTNLFVSDQTMTIGVDFEVKSLTVDGQKVKLQIWDFDGEERIRFLLPTYVRGAQGGLFVYDITNYSSIAHIDDWLSVIRKEIRAEDIFPILAVGIVPDEICERQVSAEEGIKIAKSKNLNGFIECNLKTGENVEKAFEVLTSLILEGMGSEKRKKEKVKVEAKDGEYLITYTRHLEKKVRNLETENLTLENQIKQLRSEERLKLKQDLNNLHNEIDKYKKMGI